MAQEIKNANVSVRRNSDEERSISWKDLTDKYNEPSFYTKSKRGLDAAWSEIEALVRDPETRISDVYGVLDRHGVNYRTYCAVD